MDLEVHCWCEEPRLFLMCAELLLMKGVGEGEGKDEVKGNDEGEDKDKGEEEGSRSEF